MADDKMNPDELTIESLRRWSQGLLWISVILPVLGALAVGARYYVDRYEKQLSSKITSNAIHRAQDEAARASSELGELRARTTPRTLTDAQRSAMRPMVETVKGLPVAFACRMSDGESCDLTTELAQFFLDAGCQVPAPIKTSLNDLRGYLAVAVRGSADPTVARTMVSALQAAGFDARLETLGDNSVGTWYDNVVHVVVGRKTP